MFTAFVSGFFTALGAMAAIAAVGIVTSIVVGIPTYLYFKKRVGVFVEMYNVIKRYNDNPEDFLDLKKGMPI